MPTTNVPLMDASTELHSTTSLACVIFVKIAMEFAYQSGNQKPPSVEIVTNMDTA
jgi:hypothetical protein